MKKLIRTVLEFLGFVKREKSTPDYSTNSKELEEDDTIHTGDDTRDDIEDNGISSETDDIIDENIEESQDVTTDEDVYEESDELVYEQEDEDIDLSGIIGINANLTDSQICQLAKDDEFLEAEGTFYAVFHDEEYKGIHTTLSKVSKAYQELKSSTMYSAFSKEDNKTRTYSKNKYLVIECQKS